MNLAVKESFVRAFGKRVEGVLQILAAHLFSVHPDCKFHIGGSSNDSFPLRAYLTILRCNDGDEISITVDVKTREYGLLIESDVVGEEGEIVAEGPALELIGDLSAPSVHQKLDEWFESFDRMIEEKSTDIEVAINKL